MTSQVKQLAFLTVAASSLIWSVMASAASVDPAELKQIMVAAEERGAAPVVVHLGPIGLGLQPADLQRAKAVMAEKAERLLSELGANAWRATKWDNGVGQIGLYVTAPGIARLQASAIAESFGLDSPWYSRTSLDGADGSLQELEHRLQRDGAADVIVVPNIDGIGFEFKPDGTFSISGPDGYLSSAVSQIRAMLDSIPAESNPNRAALLAALTAKQSLDSSEQLKLTIRLTRQGLMGLALNGTARMIKPFGYRDPRPMRFDESAIQNAMRDGSAEVLIVLRNPMAGGVQTKASHEAQLRSVRATMNAIRTVHGIKSTLSDLSAVDAASGVLTLSELYRLKASKDPRILAVEANKPVMTPALRTSTVAINMKPAWDAGFKAAGQTIAVFDTGVQADHKFFLNASGQSRVTGQACFGTDGYNSYGQKVVSRCPAKDSIGDSPLNYPSAGAPIANCASTTTYCEHGTHVAGIAGGRSNPAFPAGLQGVAPDANIFAVQIYSYNVDWQSGNAMAPQAFLLDVVQAFQVAVLNTQSGTSQNPLTINISGASNDAYVNQYASPCPQVSSAVTNAIKSLWDRGVPTIASTGNSDLDFHDGEIGFPACVPRVVKVGAVKNDLNANVRAVRANLPNPAAFPGDFVWVAPGGDYGASVQSARFVPGSTTGLVNMYGTSQAAPHIAGIYAAVKAAFPGITVDGASNWIKQNFGRRIPIRLCAGSGNCVDDVNFYGILLPATGY